MLSYNENKLGGGHLKYVTLHIIQNEEHSLGSFNIDKLVFTF